MYQIILGTIAKNIEFNNIAQDINEKDTKLCDYYARNNVVLENLLYDIDNTLEEMGVEYKYEEHTRDTSK